MLNNNRLDSSAEGNMDINGTCPIEMLPMNNGDKKDMIRNQLIKNYRIFSSEHIQKMQSALL